MMKKVFSVVLALAMLLALLPAQTLAEGPYDGYVLAKTFDFETVSSLTEGSDYVLGGDGGTPTVEITTDQAHSGTKSVKFGDRVKDYRRIKLNHMFSESDLTNADKGRKFKVSMWVMPTDISGGADIETVSVRVGVYGTVSTAATTSKSTVDLKAAKVGEWNEVEFEFTISDEEIAGNYNLIGVCQQLADSQTVAKTIYIDDIEIWEVPPTGISSTTVAFTDDAGNPAAMFEAGDTITASAHVTNNDETPADLALLVCLKDENGVVKAVDMVSKTLSKADGETKFEKDVIIPDGGEGYSIEAFLWNMGTLAPIVEKEALKNLIVDPEEIWVNVQNPESGNDYGSFQVYVKGSKAISKKYVRYNFQYVNKPFNEDALTDLNKEHDSNLNLYRIRCAYGAERTDDGSGVPTFQTLFGGTQIINNGEWEMAIQEKGAKDFIGGFHGDENLTSVALKIDGEPVSLSEGGKWYSGSTIEFQQVADVNRCNKPGEKVGTHTKNYTITQKDGVKLNQTMEWCVDDFTSGNGYLTMLPIMRCSSSQRFCDFVDLYDKNGDKVESYDTSDLPGGVEGDSEILTPAVPIVKAHAYSADGGIDVTVSYEAVRGIENPFAQLQIRQYNDNKMYFGSNEGRTFANGEVLEVNNIYKIDLTN